MLALIKLCDSLIELERVNFLPLVGVSAVSISNLRGHALFVGSSTWQHGFKHRFYRGRSVFTLALPKKTS